MKFLTKHKAFGNIKGATNCYEHIMSRKLEIGEQGNGEIENVRNSGPLEPEITTYNSEIKN